MSFCGILNIAMNKEYGNSPPPYREAAMPSAPPSYAEAQMGVNPSSPYVAQNSCKWNLAGGKIPRIVMLRYCLYSKQNEQAFVTK